MRPLLIHTAIVAVLAVPGLVLLLPPFMEGGGGLFSPSRFAVAFWMGWTVYGVGSTGIVVLFSLVVRLCGRKMTAATVILSHVVPLALLFISLQFGVHDRVQNVMRQRQANGGTPPRQEMRRTPPAPVAAPMKPALRYGSPAGAQPDVPEGRAQSEER